ncbi:MAG TPA: SDR family NAD(P)-dependent oxidoreductase [Acidimicrobiia bacterium]|nr:SDR family NAD(P)-dependent oxidoreductase [Acidimicrobiia bacterium]
MLVTGASRGIGAAAAVRFAAEGADVAIVARTLDQHDHLSGSLRETADRVRAHGGAVCVITADIANDDERSRIVPTAVEALGGSIDVLINNAAAAMYAPVAEFPLKRQRLTFDVNVIAPISLAQAVLPDMLARGEGWIVNVSSATARRTPNSTMGVYGASKAALNRLTQALATELAGTGVRANTIEPRAAVLTEGAAALVGDTVHADQVETLEEMVEALVAVASCSTDVSGCNLVSLDVLRDWNLVVHELDGSTRDQPANTHQEHV